MKIGVIGLGGLANKVAGNTLTKMPEIECYACASRSLEKAEAFKQTYGFEKAYGSYEAMLEDPNVELVYITTPHSEHYENMLQCIAHGKNVICEKAFTMNSQMAKDIKEKANAKGVFVTEACWPRYMPSRKIIQDTLESGIIGTPYTMTANLSYVIAQNPRITDIHLAGGALLDVGVYGLNFSLMHFGDAIERIGSSVQFTESGVDGQESITLFYKDGRMSVLTHGIYARGDRKGIIYGDKGYMVIENINNPVSIDCYDITRQFDNNALLPDPLVKHVDMPPQISGYEYEFQEAVRCIQEGKIESDSMPLSESITMMELCDELRRSWGLIYPQEK